MTALCLIGRDAILFGASLAFILAIVAGLV